MALESSTDLDLLRARRPQDQGVTRYKDNNLTFFMFFLGLRNAGVYYIFYYSPSGDHRGSKPSRRENADFAVAIKKGKAQANGLVGNVLFNLCKSGNVTAIIWYEKTRRGLDT